MKTFYKVLDKILSVFLMVLVVAMVFSISTEILLNAIIQPSASWAIKKLTLEKEQELAAEADGQEAEPSGMLAFLEGTVRRIARISAPVNTISQTLLVWIGILGSALAFRLRAHLGVDALVRVYPRKVRLALDHVSTALVGLFSLFVLLFGGFLVCKRAFETGSTTPGLEMFNRGWFYLVLVLAGALNLIYCVHHFTHPKPVEIHAPGEEQEKEEDS